MLRLVLSIVLLAILFPHAAAAAPSPGRTMMAKATECRKALKKAKIGTTEIGGHQAVLCVWKKGAKKARLIQVRDGKSRTKGFTVELLRRNGVNSLYKVEGGWQVYGIRTNVSDGWTKARKGKGRKAAKAKKSKPATYVPYGDHLDDDDIVEAGRKYLTATAKEAVARIKERDVRSLYDPDKRLDELLSIKVAVTLLVIEHIDPSDFREHGAEKMMRRVLVTVGMNKDDSYDYAVSHAAAGGLAQFLAETYGRMRDEYPDARLKSGFVAGMRDHVNAVVAQYCLLDWSLNELAEAERRRLRKRGEKETGAWLAAAYNTGTGRAVPAYEDHLDDWDEPGNGIGAETRAYVQEFREIYELLFP